MRKLRYTESPILNTAKVFKNAHIPKDICLEKELGVPNTEKWKPLILQNLKNLRNKTNTEFMY